MIYFTADTHFSHKNILKFTDRPFQTIEEHDSYLIKRWNEVVNKGDTTFILGDFAWTNHNHFIMALNGKKILIIGSHDKISQISIKNFTSVHEGMLIRTINEVPFVMTHAAMRVWERSHYGAINLYGHSHGRLPEFEDMRSMDVGVDVSPNDYAPIPIEYIIWKMNKKIPRVFDNNDDNGKSIVKENRERNLKEFLSFKEIK